AILYHAVLDEADFLDANLNRATLIGAKGTRINLMNADLSETYAPKSSFQFSQFNRANLESSNFVGADLRGSNFSHSDMTRANLQETNLQETNLQNATLAGADLSGARLDSADLSRANLKGAILSSALGLTQTQLNAACVDDQTNLPPELTRPAPCTSAKKRGKP
ncbi:pentapeptide repeat-containing protein, partial [Nitrospira sp. BLG_2]|uniref:pentapeptide repeat-containing protein n=1 Tax=Nitrospira sp. BLG_2 TaxID=3397507 RepID=UPI003B9D7C0C